MSHRSSLKTSPAWPGKTWLGSLKILQQLIHVNVSNYFCRIYAVVLFCIICSLLAVYFMHEIMCYVRFMQDIFLDKYLILNSTDIIKLFGYVQKLKIAHLIRAVVDHTHTTILQLSGFCLGQFGSAGIGRNIHPLTPIVVVNCPISASSIYYDPWCPPYSIHVPDTVFLQSVSKFSLVYFLAWHPPLRTAYISSPNYCLPFATHTDTIDKK